MTSVDVVVPCYCYGHYLRQCVESVLTQNGVDVRVLIIDDASSDSSADVATDLCKCDARVSFIHHPMNKGHIATYNEGIEWASADYYMILSADDYLLPGALARSAKLMDARPTVGLTFGLAMTLIDGSSVVQIPSKNGGVGWRVLTGLEFIEMSGAKNVVPTPTAVVRTDLQKQLGGYRPELPHSGDMEMWLRLAAHSQVGITDEYQAVYRRHATNMSLQYCAEWLPDIEQRKEAINYFVNACSSVLPDSGRLHRELLRLLAIEAIGYAGAAFNHANMELCRSLSQLAVKIDPHIRGSIPWMKLTVKQFVSPGIWNSLRAPVLRIRDMFRPKHEIA